jgi:hypothetical protein
MNFHMRLRKAVRRPSSLHFQLDQTFFGFKPADRVILHENLFDLIWHGAGRWTFADVYNMPIPMRRMWVKKLNEKLQPNNSSKSTNQSNIAKPPR